MRSSTPARAFVCFVLFAAVGTAGGPARADVSTAPHRLPSQAQLDVLGRLIADTPDESPEKPDLIFRRALMYLECADYYAALPNPEAAVKAQQWRLAGVKALLALVDPPTYAAWPRMDEALFTLADQLTRVRKEEAARKYFKRLVTEHPRSRFVANGFASFGDYYFTQNDFGNALKFYQKVLQFPDAAVGDYARYKSAWCYFDQGDLKQALDEFAAVAQSHRDERLEREARKDAVRVYAKIGDRSRARAFFERIAPPDEVDDLLGRLDELARDQDSTR